MRITGYALGVAAALLLAAPSPASAQYYGPQNEQQWQGNRQSRGSYGQPYQNGPAIRDVPSPIRPPDQLFGSQGVPQNRGWNEQQETRYPGRYDGRNDNRGRGWDQPYEGRSQVPTEERYWRQREQGGDNQRWRR